MSSLFASIRDGDVDKVRHLCCVLHVDTNETCYVTPAGVELPPLLWARFWADQDGIIQILLDNGADVAITNKIIEREGISNLLKDYRHIFEEYSADRERRLAESMAILWAGKSIKGCEHQDLFLRDTCVDIANRYLSGAGTKWSLKRY